jgi:hypothetical protein
MAGLIISPLDGKSPHPSIRLQVAGSTQDAMLNMKTVQERSLNLSKRSQAILLHAITGEAYRLTNFKAFKEADNVR